MKTLPFIFLVALTSVAIGSCADAGSTPAERADGTPSEVEAYIPTLNNTQQTAPDGASLDIVTGRLMFNPRGCLFLDADSGPLDLAWPSDYSLSDKGGTTHIDNGGTTLALRIGHQESLVGIDAPQDEALTCEAVPGSTPFLVVDFLGKTTGGG